jgi:hypothetical protein
MQGGDAVVFSLLVSFIYCQSGDVGSLWGYLGQRSGKVGTLLKVVVETK